MRKIRYAVIGLGYISQVAMLPAFRHARRNSVLAALVSGHRTKRRALSRRYGVKIDVDYDGFDRLARSGDIDAVYIGLPNTMHREFTLRAARAGQHVLCDKPLATSVKDGAAMLAAARRNKVRLMTAYRLHFEPGNVTTLKLIRGGAFGPIRFFSSDFSMQVKPGNIRTQDELGGGPLFDLGIYCVNAARHVFNAEPVEVHAAAAFGRDRRFRDVEEMAQVVLRFPGDGLASFTCSFGAGATSVFQVRGIKGGARLEQAYEMVGPKKLIIDGPDGMPKRTKSFPNVDQFAPLLVHFSDCIARGKTPVPSGEEGLADLRVIEAIHQSIASGRTVRLRKSRPLGARLPVARAMKLPPHRKPGMVQAEGPSQD
jgi:glucose-fructose oxidoreductase